MKSIPIRIREEDLKMLKKIVKPKRREKKVDYLKRVIEIFNAMEVERRDQINQWHREEASTGLL